MEGFLHFRINVWLRRAVTLIPALIVIGLGFDPLQILVMSQVSLSFQLPLAVIPLILFTNNKTIMGEYANRKDHDDICFHRGGDHYWTQRFTGMAKSDVNQRPTCFAKPRRSK